jgi:hypothetical protein
VVIPEVGFVKGTSAVSPLLSVILVRVYEPATWSPIEGSGSSFLLHEMINTVTKRNNRAEVKRECFIIEWLLEEKKMFKSEL